jgi:anti-sigma regulatory factor (Ser/Thr protein kinase)
VALEDGLREARDAAQAAAAAKSDFLANMSHEIRTPLTAIIGFAKMLSLHGRYDETAERYIARVARAGETLLSLINDVLDFSKLEAGQVELAAAPCDLEVMLSDAVLMFAAQAEAKGLVLSFAPVGDLPPRVLLDAGRVRQIVMNLVGNAIKFTVQGEVRVTVRHTAGRLHLEVADSGQGISAAQQRRLFQRFSQADASTTRKHGGTGLGLAICKGLVEAMDGVITVVSAEDDGAVFTVEVPAPSLSGADRMDGPQWPELLGVRVLALCADAAEAAPLRAVLGSLGVDATFAPASEAAQTAGAFPYDVLILGALEPRLLAHLDALDGVNAGVPALHLGSAPLGGPLSPAALARALLGALELAASPSPASAVSATAA